MLYLEESEQRYRKHTRTEHRRASLFPELFLIIHLFILLVLFRMILISAFCVMTRQETRARFSGVSSTTTFTRLSFLSHWSYPFSEVHLEHVRYHSLERQGGMRDRLRVRDSRFAPLAFCLSNQSLFYTVGSSNGKTSPCEGEVTGSTPLALPHPG